ncbi:hypothetical protein O181_098861 [Austropuccinia psidii MF-1]|uniref:Uncharacterized protein n=1 Tax=Austropuccinia psidii MF-1 TaxID=1389203 RepID=A0A9Q3PGC5_9BASI|nr:hypothetical protein [Austropuccinia psidii MF-1]
MQQSLAINNTQQVVSIIPPTNTPFVPIVSSPPQSINPQLLLQAHPNYLPSPDTPCHSPTLMVSQSHGHDFPPISTEEEQTHQHNLPNTESPHNRPSAQSDHSNICESSSNLPISNETHIHSRADVHQSSPHDTSIEPPPPSCDDVPPQSMESSLSPPLHAPTPGLNNLNQEVDCPTQNPPTLEETEQSPISQPASPPNIEFSIFSNEFRPQFSKFLIQDDQLKPNIKQHLKQSTLW